MCRADPRKSTGPAIAVAPSSLITSRRRHVLLEESAGLIVWQVDTRQAWKLAVSCPSCRNHCLKIQSWNRITSNGLLPDSFVPSSAELTSYFYRHGFETRTRCQDAIVLVLDVVLILERSGTPVRALLSLGLLQSGVGRQRKARST